MLSTNIKTKIAVFNDDRKIPITEDQYVTIQLAKENGYNTEVKIKDPDTGDMLYHGKVGKIDEFTEIKRGQNSGKRYICDFGTRHPLNEECECRKKYKIEGCVFKEKMRNFGIMYTADVNDSNRSKILNSNHKNHDALR